MKYTALRAFEKHLEASAPSHFGDVYLILSKDDYERKSASQLLITHVSKGLSIPGMNVQVFDAEKADARSLLDELYAMALFSAKRLIIIHNVDKWGKSITEKLEDYFASPNRSICLGMTAQAINHSTNFFKKAEKIGIVLDIAEAKPWEKEKMIIDWVIQACQSAGKRIDLQTSTMLVKRVGTDQMFLRQELDKLFCYVGERNAIVPQDISAICTSLNVENIWQVGESLFQREPSAALRIAKAMIEDGAPFLTILRQIRSQFLNALHIASIMATGGGPNEVTAQFPYMRGGILDKNMRQAQHYGLHKLKTALITIDQVELQAKNSASDSQWLIEYLIIKLVKL